AGAVQDEQSRLVAALGRMLGDEVWRKIVVEERHEGILRGIRFQSCHRSDTIGIVFHRLALAARPGPTKSLLSSTGSRSPNWVGDEEGRRCDSVAGPPL